jgi:hypothetical protein
MKEIKLASSNDCGPWRIARLERVRGYICALADHYGNTTLQKKISEFLDYEGTLTVSWKKEPTEGELEFIDKAWASSIAGENAGNIEHLVLPEGPKPVKNRSNGSPS